MSNPFDNPWQNNNNKNGPVYGNAYEDDTNQSYYNPTMNTTSPVPGYTNNNAWTESNKTQYEQPAVDAYQYSGTPYGNQQNQFSSNNVYSNTTASPQPAHLSTPQPEYVKPTDSHTPSISNTVTASNPYHRPDKWRVLLRFIILVCSIGHLGFAAGARPYSQEDVPFSTAACFYYLFAVAVLSILWSGFHLMFSCWRCMLKKPKMNRPIMFGIDLLFAILWGIGIIVEIAKYRCTWGGKFCAFYNVSIFWGFVTFVAFIIASCWDVFGACRNRRS